MLRCNVVAVQTVARAPSLSTAIRTISFISNHEDSVKSRKVSSTVTVAWSTVKTSSQRLLLIDLRRKKGEHEAAVVPALLIKVSIR